MYRDLLKDLSKKSDEVIEKLITELKNIHTGRANASLVENVKVSYYGQQTAIKQMANITIPDSNMITITPWDMNGLGDIELAIRNSNLGLNPINDGKTIRIVLPPLTEERRNEFVKFVEKLSEEAKVLIRTARADIWNEVKKMEKNNELTEDDRYKAEEEINKIVKQYNDKIDKLAEEKSQELLKV